MFLKSLRVQDSIMEKTMDNSVSEEMLAQPHNCSVSWDPAFLADVPREVTKMAKRFLR